MDGFQMIKTLFLFILLLTMSVVSESTSQSTTTLSTSTSPSKRCLYINSYHKGYEWSDGIEAAAYATLKSTCSMKTFYMDTKNHDGVDFAKSKALEAKAWIDTEKPDVVIVADDSAVEYVLMAHYKDKKLPFVFCGINWEAKKYGLPYKNATGMIEVAPVEDLVAQIKEILPRAKVAVYLSGDVEADRVNHLVYQQVYKKHNMTLKSSFAKTMKEWKTKFIESQKADVVILANYVGIHDWSYDEAKSIVKAHGKKVSLTYHEFMKPLATMSLTKIPAEQGEWAGKVAIEILNGTAPEKIPVAVNRRWNMYVNEEVAGLTRTEIPEAISRKASKTTL
jgi:ABC-type uncharacterized transport system substrate-binding protein